MPVIKKQGAASMLKEAIVLDLGDLARQGERIIAAAQEKARQILAQAQQRMERETNTAKDAAVVAGREQGIARGLEEGRAAGRKEAFEKAAAELRQTQQTLIDLAKAWEEQREALMEDARQSVIDFALQFAERVTHRVIEVDPSVIVDQVGAALAHVLRPLEVTVRINPQDKPELEAAVPELLSEFSHLKGLSIAEDQAISRGGCELLFGQGAVDATIQSQIQRLVETMLPADPDDEPAADESVAVEPQQPKA